MARRSLRFAANQQSETVTQACDELGWRQHPRAHRGQLNGQRQAVEPSTHFEDLGRVALGDRKARLGRVRPLLKQVDGIHFA